MDCFRSQRGALSLGSIIFLLVIGSGIYVGFKMAMPWVKYYQVESLFKNEVVRLRTTPEEEVREAINKKLDELEVVLSGDGVNIIREEGKPPRIEATYGVEVDIAGFYKHKYNFHPIGEAPKSVGYN